MTIVPNNLQNQTLQIVRLGNGERNGVVLGLRAAFEYPHRPAGVERGLRDQFQVDFAIAGHRRFQVVAGLGEGRRLLLGQEPLGRCANGSRQHYGPLGFRAQYLFPLTRIARLDRVSVQFDHVLHAKRCGQIRRQPLKQEPKIVRSGRFAASLQEQRFQIPLGALLGVKADGVEGAVLLERQSVFRIPEIVVGLGGPPSHRLGEVRPAAHTPRALPEEPA